MPVRVSVDVQARRAVRQLARVRTKGVFAAQRATMTAGAALLLTALQRQWEADMAPRRRSFPRSVLRKHKAFVDFKTGHVKRPARVVSIAADDLLRLQIRGGLRLPKKGRSLLVPATRRRSKAQLYRAGDYLFRPLKRKDRYAGVLVRSARIPRRWRVAQAVRRVERLLPRVALRELRRELRSALSRP